MPCKETAITVNNKEYQVIRLLEVNRDQERLLKEFIPGDTVEVLVKQDNLHQDTLDQIRAMCRTVYAAGLNIDYYPTNFAFRDGVLHYIDFEYNQYAPKWDFENWGSKYWSKTPKYLEAFCK